MNDTTEPISANEWLKMERRAQKSQSDLCHDPSKDEKNQGLLSPLRLSCILSLILCYEDSPSNLFHANPSRAFFILPALGRSSLPLSTRLLKLSDQLLTPSSSTQQAHSVLWDELWLTAFLSPLHHPYLPTYLSAALSYSPPCHFPQREKLQSVIIYDI